MQGPKNIVKILLQSNSKLIAFSVLFGVVSGLCGMGLIYLINIALQNDSKELSGLSRKFSFLLLISLSAGLMSQLFLNGRP